jgi:hypothetical protein
MSHDRGVGGGQPHCFDPLPTFAKASVGKALKGKGEPKVLFCHGFYLIPHDQLPFQITGSLPLLRGMSCDIKSYPINRSKVVALG